MASLRFQAIRHNLHLALVVGILRASLVELMHKTSYLAIDLY